MAISIPIISEFNGDGVTKAVKQFKQLETVGQKAQFALKKAAVPAAAALAGLTAVIGDSIKAATEDAEAQALLARQLRASAFATDETIKATEDFISQTSMAAAVADDQLRPALSKLVTATGEVGYAQELLNVALDVSAATGKDLETVSEALSRGYAGNTKALGALSPELKAMIKEGASFSDVLKTLQFNFEGAADTAANTAAGGMRRLSISLGEAKEGLGAAFLPVLEAALPKLQAFANWAIENPGLLKAVVIGLGATAAAVIALNVAMSLNPFAAAAAGIGLLVTGIVVAYQKFETFRRVVQTVVNGVISYFEGIANAWITVTNAIIRGLNIIKPGRDIPSIPSVNFGRMGGGAESIGGALGARFMATGGVVTGPTLAVLGEAGPEAVVPLDRMGGMGNVTINVNGGDPEAVVNALRRYMNRYGNIPIRTTAP